jgi:hypothetical protein
MFFIFFKDIESDRNNAEKYAKFTWNVGFCVFVPDFFYKKLTIVTCLIIIEAEDWDLQ